MGNTDSFASALASQGTNNTIAFDDGYFSFAFGNEIAFCVDGKYWILNCNNDLWNKVKKKIAATKKRKVLAKWWETQSNNYEVSDWSADFNEIK